MPTLLEMFCQRGKRLTLHCELDLFIQLEGVKVLTQVRWWHQVLALKDVYAHVRWWWHWLVEPNGGTRAPANADGGGSLSWRHVEGSYLAWLPHHVIALVVFDGRPGANLSNYWSFFKHVMAKRKAMGWDWLGLFWRQMSPYSSTAL